MRRKERGERNRPSTRRMKLNKGTEPEGTHICCLNYILYICQICELVLVYTLALIAAKGDTYKKAHKE